MGVREEMGRVEGSRARGLDFGGGEMLPTPASGQKWRRRRPFPARAGHLEEKAWHGGLVRLTGGSRGIWNIPPLFIFNYPIWLITLEIQNRA